jgi:secreted trypsin-like serine protease
MSANTLIRNSLWATLLAALVAAMVSFIVFVPNSEAAPASDKPTYEPYIINGEPVPNGKYPFMVSVQDLTREGTVKDRHVCGGSLIDKTHVLTGGHCVFSRDVKGVVTAQKPQDTQVIVGRTVLTSNQGQVRNVKDIDVHPRFKAAPLAGTFDYPYDAAVLTLSRPVKGIKPIELASSGQNNLERPGRDATAAGWGNQKAYEFCGTQPPRSTPNRMQEAQLPIISDSRADKLLDQQQPAPACPPDFPETDFVPRLMIAAGAEDEGTCQGDSGGPLFVRTSGNGDGDNGDDRNGGSGGKYTQIGITSWGLGCGVEDSPDVFAEVNAKPILSFIERAADLDDDNGDDDNDK